MIKQSVPYILILLLIATAGCKEKSARDKSEKASETTTEIKGTLLDGGGENVALEEMGAREYIPVDTVQCDSSGAFNILFYQDREAFYVLRYGSSGYVTLLVKPGETVDFRGRLNDKDIYTIKGSPGSSLLQQLAEEHKKALGRLEIIARKNRENVSSPEYAELKQQLDLQFDSITTAFHHYSTSFIHEHPDSPAILIALYNLYGQGFPVFDPQTDLPVYQFVDSVLMVNHSELEAVRLLHAQVLKAQLVRDTSQQSNLLKKGEIAPDFVSSRPDGSEMALSDLRGNIVLLSFWASWSNLCREENATLVLAEARFGEKNFRILQVSLDDNREDWIRAIETDDLKWDQVSDLKRWDTPVVDLYGVERIPFIVLIDPDGRIIEKDLYGEQLLNKLDQFLNN